MRDKEGEAGHVPGHTSEVQYAPTAGGMEAGVWNRLVMHACSCTVLYAADKGLRG